MFCDNISMTNVSVTPLVTVLRWHNCCHVIHCLGGSIGAC